MVILDITKSKHNSIHFSVSPIKVGIAVIVIKYFNYFLKGTKQLVCSTKIRTDSTKSNKLWPINLCFWKLANLTQFSAVQMNLRAGTEAELSQQASQVTNNSCYFTEKQAKIATRAIEECMKTTENPTECVQNH